MTLEHEGFHVEVRIPSTLNVKLTNYIMMMI